MFEKKRKIIEREKNKKIIACAHMCVDNVWQPVPRFSEQPRDVISLVRIIENVAR